MKNLEAQKLAERRIAKLKEEGRFDAHMKMMSAKRDAYYEKRRKNKAKKA